MVRCVTRCPVSPALNRTADGSLYSTVNDLVRWDHALDGDGVLPHAQLERMWQIDAHSTGQRPLYHFGYGWENNHLKDQRLIEYDGNWQGFQAVMSRYAGAHVSVILLTNLSLCRTERMAHAVAGLMDPALAPYPRRIVDHSPAMTQRFRRFLEALRQSPEQSGSAAFSAVEVSRATLHRTLVEAGPVLDLSVAEDHLAGGVRERVYRVEQTDMVDFYRVAYRGDRARAIELLREY